MSRRCGSRSTRTSTSRPRRSPPRGRRRLERSSGRLIGTSLCQQSCLLQSGRSGAIAKQPSCRRLLAWHCVCHLPAWLFRACGPACRGKAGCVKIVVEVQDLPPGSASSYTVASYVRAVLKVRALRRELAHALLEAERCKKALRSRLQSGMLLAEAESLLEGLRSEADLNDDHFAR